MANQEKGQNKSDHLIKNLSGEANGLIHKAVDTSGTIVKTISGKGGLVGKAVDASGNLIKNASDLGNEVVDKSVDTSSKALHYAADKVKKK